MVDTDTFLTTLYVMVDDFCKSELPLEKEPGPEAALSRSEVVTLSIFGQWSRFRNQRDFYRFALDKGFCKNQKRQNYETKTCRRDYRSLSGRGFSNKKEG